MSDWQRDSGYSAEGHDRWVTGNYGEDSIGEEDKKTPRKTKAPSLRRARYRALILARTELEALAQSLDYDYEQGDKDPERTHPRITSALRNIASRLDDQAWKLRD